MRNIGPARRMRRQWACALRRGLVGSISFDREALAPIFCVGRRLLCERPNLKPKALRSRRRGSLSRNAQTTEGELPLANAMQQLNAGNRRRGALEDLEAGAGPMRDFTPRRCLLDHVVKARRRPQLRVFPCLVLTTKRPIAYQSSKSAPQPLIARAIPARSFQRLVRRIRHGRAARIDKGPQRLIRRRVEGRRLVFGEHLFP